MLLSFRNSKSANGLGGLDGLVLAPRSVAAFFAGVAVVAVVLRFNLILSAPPAPWLSALVCLSCPSVCMFDRAGRQLEEMDKHTYRQ